MSFSLDKPRKANGSCIAFRIISFIFIVIGIVLRCGLRSPISLWEDEIIAVTHAYQTFFKVIYESLLTDMHPPLYFLELHIWSYFGHSDIWMIANSVILSILAIASIYYVVRRLENPQHGLLVAAVYSILPVGLWMAEEVRMYAFLSIMLIWLYYFIHRIFALQDKNAKSSLGAFLLSISIIYTHAIGFIAIFFFGLYAASYLYTRHANRKEWLNWLAIFGGAAVAAIPILLSSIIRQADMAPIDSISEVFFWMSSLIVGAGDRGMPWLPAAGFAIYLAIVIPGTIFKPTRRMTLCFLIVPIILCLIMELATKPLFKTNFFPNFCTPFFAIVIGYLISSLPLKNSWKALTLTVISLALITMAFANRAALNTANDYFKPAADIIETQKRPGDVVWAPEASAFWGMAWYLIGPNGKSPLTVRAPLKQGSHWQEILDYLGPDLADKLALAPKSQMMLTKDGMPVFTANESQAIVEKAQRVWLVTFMRNDLPKGVPGEKLGPLHRTQSFAYSSLSVNLYERDNH